MDRLGHRTGAFAHGLAAGRIAVGPGLARAGAAHRSAQRHHRRANRPHDPRRRLAPAEYRPPHRTPLAAGASAGRSLPQRRGAQRQRLQPAAGAVRQHHHLPRAIPEAAGSSAPARPAHARPRKPPRPGLGGADPARPHGQTARRGRRQRSPDRPRARPR